MATYRLVVFEKKIDEIRCSVKARNLAEATRKAEQGETEEEDYVRTLEVISREVDGMLEAPAKSAKRVNKKLWMY